MAAEPTQEATLGLEIVPDGHGFWEVGMERQDEKQEAQIPYPALCRGAATYILLGKKKLDVEAGEIALLYGMDPAVVRADIDRIVQAERRKVGGVFEVK